MAIVGGSPGGESALPPNATTVVAVTGPRASGEPNLARRARGGKHTFQFFEGLSKPYEVT